MGKNRDEDPPLKGFITAGRPRMNDSFRTDADCMRIGASINSIFDFCMMAFFGQKFPEC